MASYTWLEEPFIMESEISLRAQELAKDVIESLSEEGLVSAII